MNFEDLLDLNGNNSVEIMMKGVPHATTVFTSVVSDVLKQLTPMLVEFIQRQEIEDNLNKCAARADMKELNDKFRFINADIVREAAALVSSLPFAPHVHIIMLSMIIDEIVKTHQGYISNLFQLKWEQLSPKRRN